MSQVHDNSSPQYDVSARETICDESGLCRYPTEEEMTTSTTTTLNANGGAGGGNNATGAAAGNRTDTGSGNSTGKAAGKATSASAPLTGQNIVNFCLLSIIAFVSIQCLIPIMEMFLMYFLPNFDPTK